MLTAVKDGASRKFLSEEYPRLYSNMRATVDQWYLSYHNDIIK